VRLRLRIGLHFAGVLLFAGGLTAVAASWHLRRTWGAFLHARLEEAADQTAPLLAERWADPADRARAAAQLGERLRLHVAPSTDAAAPRVHGPVVVRPVVAPGGARLGWIAVAPKPGARVPFSPSLFHLIASSATRMRASGVRSSCDTFASSSFSARRCRGATRSPASPPR
jgi:hypothetical protein